MSERIEAALIKNASRRQPPSDPPTAAIRRSAEGVEHRLLSADLAENSVTAGEVASNSIWPYHIIDGSIQANDPAADSVGCSELKGLTTAVSAGTVVSAGGFGNAEVTCPPNKMAIGGGFSWQDDEPNSIIYSTPSESDPNQTWGP